MKKLILIIALFTVTVSYAQNVRVNINVNDKYLQTISTPGIQSRPPVADPYGDAISKPLNLPECLSEEETDIHVYMCPIYDTNGRTSTLLYAFDKEKGRWICYTAVINRRLTSIMLWSTVYLISQSEAQELNRKIDQEDN